MKYITINTHGGPLPEIHGDWIDLCTAEETVIYKGEYKRISLGVSMQLPEGYYAEMAPRSSTAEKWGIIMANSIGIIDHDYNGDNDIWQFPAYAFRTTTIPKGTRIAQFRIVKQSEKIRFIPTDRLYNDDRGGIGSTGD